jgi:hypothetical protein
LLRGKYCWVRWLFPVSGLLALIWFLVRVLPKPSRATYPCQRVAMPIAGSFVLWVGGIIGSAFAYRRAKKLLWRRRFAGAAVCLAVAIAAGMVAISNMSREPVIAGDSLPNSPIGTAKGIHPGRVVWVHDPNATDWDGYYSPEHWWQNEHTNLAAVEKMVSKSIRALAGESTDEAAWEAIFKYFNNSRGKGDIGYEAGEKIAIKINLTTCNARSWQVDPVTYDKRASIMNRIDNSPQMILALLRQLVYTAGADPCDITVGDPTGMFPNYAYNMLHPEFPNVRYMDNYGGPKTVPEDPNRRTRAEFSDVAFYWSTPDADDTKQDYLPVCFAEADYIINFSVLKGHGAGITLCAKNHYGSLIRCPDGYLRDVEYEYSDDYYDMHDSLSPTSSGMGHYRALVDLMGHSQLGGKTLLYLVDGLFGGYYWDAHPYKWEMEPFNGDWPSSLFASQDAVAIDSVGYDFLLEEWPHVVNTPASQGGAEDYLHEAAEANDPCSGTFYDPDNDGNVVRLESLGVHEHWNNPIDKQYWRNLYPQTGAGIELVALDSTRSDLYLDGCVDVRDFAVLAAAWHSRAGDDNWNRHCDISDPNDDVIDEYDVAIFAADWLKGVQ